MAADRWGTPHFRRICAGDRGSPAEHLGDGDFSCGLRSPEMPGRTGSANGALGSVALWGARLPCVRRGAVASTVTAAALWPVEEVRWSDGQTHTGTQKPTCSSLARWARRLSWKETGGGVSRASWDARSSTRWSASSPSGWSTVGPGQIDAISVDEIQYAKESGYPLVAWPVIYRRRKTWDVSWQGVG